LAHSGVILAFDYGLSQVGVAVGNRIVRTSQSLLVLRARDGVPNWAEVEKLIQEWLPDLLVVGLPLNMDDSPSELSARAQRFGRRLEGRYQLPVEYMDERLSSFEAKSQLREQGHRGDYREVPADAVAAQLILQSWLNENPGEG
jgi:putative Holliday junction resolvase